MSVRVFGMKKRTDLNGKTGTVKRMLKNGTRVAVAIVLNNNNKTELMSISLDNLVIVGEEKMTGNTRTPGGKIGMEVLEIPPTPANNSSAEDSYDDGLKPMKCKHWNSWFQQPIPMIGNIAPQEAATTVSGRKKLEEWFNYADSMRVIGRQGAERRGEPYLDMNIPTRYAKWKLGIGPGKSSDFVKEEEVFNFMTTVDTSTPGSAYRQTNRTSKHTKKLEKKKVSMYIPARCEHTGCTKRGYQIVKACARCNCAYYCSREHQVEDWSKHKLDCKFLSKLGNIDPTPFTFEQELQKYPIGCFPLTKKKKPSLLLRNVDVTKKNEDENEIENEKCFICHSKTSEVNLRYTECCNLPICDNSHEYEINSYSRDFCHRSHDMYTACSTHHHEEHAGDWRVCVDCNTSTYSDNTTIVRPFHTTNRFLTTPSCEQFLPQGSMLTFACDNFPGCKSRMLPGHSTMSYRDGKTICGLCSE